MLQFFREDPFQDVSSLSPLNRRLLLEKLIWSQALVPQNRAPMREASRKHYRTLDEVIKIKSENQARKSEKPNVV